MAKENFFHISAKGEISPLGSLEEALKKIRSEGYIWLHYIDPQPEDLHALQEPLKLNGISIEDCFDMNTLPKVNEYPEHLFVTFNAYFYENCELGFIDINLFLGHKFLVSVIRQDLNKKHSLFDAETLLKLNIKNIKNNPSFLMHTILDFIVDHKYEAIEAIEDELVQIEETINVEYSKFEPLDLQRLRRFLLMLRKSLFHEREILLKICRKDFPFFSEASIIHYRNIYDHIVRLFELIEMDREIVTSLLQINLSIVNNKITESANKTNAFIRRLTLITTIFMPLTLISGIGGMSEFTMMTGAENWKFVYPGLILIMTVIGAINYYLLKKLEKKDGVHEK